MISEANSAAPVSGRPGFFIVFEGIDGSGKSTQVELLNQFLQDSGHDVEVTREPGGTVLAEKIRSLVLDPVNAPIDDRTEALLFAAARSNHVQARIEPALRAGRIIISDRFIASSIAYQGAGRDLGETWVAELNEEATGGLQPDLTIILDLSEADALARRQQRETEQDTNPDRIEQAPDGFQTVLRESFLRQAQADPERFVVVDALQTPEAMSQQINAHVAALIPEVAR